MHRNTLFVVIVLAVFAIIVLVVNITKPSEAPVVIPVSPAPQAEQMPTLVFYANPTCGIEFMYPDTLSPFDSGAGGTIFVNKENQSEPVVVTCQEDIPRPPLMEDRMEEVFIGSVSATLFHDASPKDGTPIDKLIFTHPVNGKDVYIAGLGEPFNTVIGNVSLLLATPTDSGESPPPPALIPEEFSE